MNIDPTKLKSLWYDGKMHTISIYDGKENINLDNLRECYKKILEDKKDQCNDIFHLGAVLTGSEGPARGFLLGWLVKSIRDDIQTKKSVKLTIVHEEEKLPDEEIKTYFVESLRSLADEIEKDADFTPKKAPINVSQPDGTELYS